MADLRLPIVDSLGLGQVVGNNLERLLLDLDEVVHVALVRLVDVEQVVVRDHALEAVVLVLLLAGKHDRKSMPLADHLNRHVHLLFFGHLTRLIQIERFFFVFLACGRLLQELVVVQVAHLFVI